MSLQCLVQPASKLIGVTKIGKTLMLSTKYILVVIHILTEKCTLFYYTKCPTIIVYMEHGGTNKDKCIFRVKVQLN